MVDPRFRLSENRGFLPEPFTVEDYLGRARPLGIGGGAVVSGSFQGHDQTYLCDALERLGPSFVGVTQLPDTVPAATIEALERVGVRGVRANLRRHGPLAPAALLALAKRVHEAAGWHVEVYLEGGAIAALLPTLIRMPAVVIDHLGLSADGLPGLLRHAAAGGYVKASGFGRVDFDIRDALRAIHRENPDALLFGTDLPGTRAPRPFLATDIELVRDALGDVGARRALCDNALALYRPRRGPLIDPAPGRATSGR